MREVIRWRGDIRTEKCSLCSDMIAQMQVRRLFDNPLALNMMHNLSKHPTVRRTARSGSDLSLSLTNLGTWAPAALMANPSQGCAHTRVSCGYSSLSLARLECSIESCYLPSDMRLRRLPLDETSAPQVKEPLFHSHSTNTTLHQCKADSRAAAVSNFHSAFFDEPENLQLGRSVLRKRSENAPEHVGLRVLGYMNSHTDETT